MFVVVLLSVFVFCVCVRACVCVCVQCVEDRHGRAYICHVPPCACACACFFAWRSGGVCIAPVSHVSVICLVVH
jgi:hypothetical protein